MKKLFCLPLLLFAVSVYAAPPTMEFPFQVTGTPTCTSISTSSWTSIGTPTAGRSGIYVTEISTNSANMIGHFGTSVTPTITTAIQEILFKPGQTQFHNANDAAYLYLLSLNTSAETACYGEVKQ